MPDNKNKNLIKPYEILKDGKKPFNGKSYEDLINPIEVLPEGSKSFEEKIYIILVIGDNNDGFFNGNYIIANGRTECYRKIQNILEAFGEDIDIHESKVIVETNTLRNGKPTLMPWDDCVSIYSFCKSIEEYYKGVDSFNIENYNYEKTYENNENDNTPIDLDVADEYIKSLKDTENIVNNMENVEGNDTKYHMNMPILQNDNDSHNI